MAVNQTSFVCFMRVEERSKAITFGHCFERLLRKESSARRDFFRGKMRLHSKSAVSQSGAMKPHRHPPQRMLATGGPGNGIEAVPWSLYRAVQRDRMRIVNRELHSVLA